MQTRSSDSNLDDDWALILHETFSTKKDVESELQVSLLNPNEKSEVAKKRQLDDSSLTEAGVKCSKQIIPSKKKKRQGEIQEQSMSEDAVCFRKHRYGVNDWLLVMYDGMPFTGCH